MKKEMKKLMVVILGLICIICVWLTGTTGVREIRRLVCRQRELSVVYRVSDFVLGNGRMPFDQKELALWEGNRFLSRRLPFEMVFHSGTFNGTGVDGVLVSRVDNGSVRPLVWTSGQIRRLVRKGNSHCIPFLSTKQKELYGRLGDEHLQGNERRGPAVEIIDTINQILMGSRLPSDYEDRMIRLFRQDNADPVVRFTALRNLGIAHGRHLVQQEKCPSIRGDRVVRLLEREARNPKSPFSAIALYGFIRMMWRHVPDMHGELVSFLLECVKVRTRGNEERELAAIYLLGETGTLWTRLNMILPNEDRAYIRNAIAVMREYGNL